MSLRVQDVVQAVLVANVSFLGYVTPPGGPHPYWETCNNHVYVAFLVLNGLAFLFSLGATGVALHPRYSAHLTAP